MRRLHVFACMPNVSFARKPPISRLQPSRPMRHTAAARADPPPRSGSGGGSAIHRVSPAMAIRAAGHTQRKARSATPDVKGRFGSRARYRRASAESAEPASTTPRLVTAEQTAADRRRLTGTIALDTPTGATLAIATATRESPARRPADERSRGMRSSPSRSGDAPAGRERRLGADWTPARARTRNRSAPPANSIAAGIARVRLSVPL